MKKRYLKIILILSIANLLYNVYIAFKNSFSSFSIIISSGIAFTVILAVIAYIDKSEKFTVKPVLYVILFICILNLLMLILTINRTSMIYVTPIVLLTSIMLYIFKILKLIKRKS